MKGYKVHAFIDGELYVKIWTRHLPRTGDTLRFRSDLYTKVTEIIWCMDESDAEGQRVNLRMEVIE